MTDQFQSYDQQSGLVSTTGGRQFPASALDPAQLGAIPTTSHVQAAPVTLSGGPDPGATPKAKQLLGGLQLVSQTIQRGAPKGTVDAAMASANVADAQLAQSAEEAAVGAADKRAGMLTQQREDTMQREADARAQEAVNRQRAEIARQSELALRSQEDPDVDPNRLVNSMSTGTKILTVILGALAGAAGAATGQKYNVLGQINKAIDDDIMAQKEQIASGRIRRGNLVDYFQRQGMSEDAAADAARNVALANVEKLTQIEAAQFDTENARSQASLITEQAKAAREARNSELRLKIEGQVGSSSQYARPAPAGGASASDILKETLAARDLAALGKTGQTVEELAKAEKEAYGREADAAKRTESEGKAAGAVDAIEQFARDAGLLVRNGRFLVNPEDRSTLNARQRERAGNIIGTGSRKIEFSRKAAEEAFGRLQSGGVIGGDEAARFSDMIGGATTDAQLADALNAVSSIVVPRLNRADRGASAQRGAIPYAEKR